jgi:hypothetical protein
VTIQALPVPSTGAHKIVRLIDQFGAYHGLPGEDVTVVAVMEREEETMGARTEWRNGQNVELPAVYTKNFYALVCLNTETELARALEAEKQAQAIANAAPRQIENLQQELAKAREDAKATIERLEHRISILVGGIDEARKERDESRTSHRKLEADLARVRQHIGKKIWDEALASGSGDEDAR